jgi:putative spermidine/putrescine transport system ATP-binding protein
MRMIAGHEDITAGDIYIGDLKINGLPPTARNTAMMFQNYALFPHKTVWQNIEFGLKMRKVPAAERRQRIEDMLGIVGLQQFADRKPQMLSGGQQQRVALARALITHPQVLLLDEPLSALDESLRVKTRGELRKLQRQFGMTFIQVTHNQDEAYSLSDQIVVMDHGRIDQVGTPQEIFSKPLSRFVASFTGDNNIFEGQVASAVEDAGGYLIQLDVEGIGALSSVGATMPRWAPRRPAVSDPTICASAISIAPVPKVLPVLRLSIKSPDVLPPLNLPAISPEFP